MAGSQRTKTKANKIGGEWKKTGGYDRSTGAAQSSNEATHLYGIALTRGVCECTKRPNTKSTKNGKSCPAQKTVTVVVEFDGESTTFEIDRGLLVEHSAYFKDALGFTKRRKGQAEVIHLPDINPLTFGVFHQFLAAHKFPRFSFEHECLDEKHKTPEEKARKLAHCWHLGETLTSPSFKDAITDLVAERLSVPAEEGGWSAQEIHTVFYSVSHTKSALRRLLVDAAVGELETRGQKAEGKGSARFWCDVAVGLLDSKRAASGDESAASKKGHRCQYHEHESMMLPCYRKMR